MAAGKRKTGEKLSVYRDRLKSEQCRVDNHLMGAYVTGACRDMNVSDVVANGRIRRVY